jgi:hypothetical protein
MQAADTDVLDFQHHGGKQLQGWNQTHLTFIATLEGPNIF